MKYRYTVADADKIASPSSRRAWIEITYKNCTKNCAMSPSSRRAWIEIRIIRDILRAQESPSSRRAWIEIESVSPWAKHLPVALLAEGVD